MTDRTTPDEPVAWAYKCYGYAKGWRAQVSITEPDPEKAIIRNVQPLFTRPASRGQASDDQWGEWQDWDGSSDYGPDLEAEEYVNVGRRGPDAKCYLYAERHHIDWLHNGGKEDVLCYRRRLSAPTPQDAAGDLVERALSGLENGGPHEWGYRDPVTGNFIADDTPFKMQDALTVLRSQSGLVDAANAMIEASKVTRFLVADCASNGTTTGALFENNAVLVGRETKLGQALATIQEQDNDE